MIVALVLPPFLSLCNDSRESRNACISHYCCIISLQLMQYCGKGKKKPCVIRTHFMHNSQFRLNSTAVTSTSHSLILDFSLLWLEYKLSPAGSCLNVWPPACDIILKVLESLGGRTSLTEVAPWGQESESYTYSVFQPVFFCFQFTALGRKDCLIAVSPQPELSYQFLLSWN